MRLQNLQALKFCYKNVLWALLSTGLTSVLEQCAENHRIRPFSFRKRAFEGNNGVRDITLLIGWGMSGLSQNSSHFFCG